MLKASITNIIKYVMMEQNDDDKILKNLEKFDIKEYLAIIREVQKEWIWNHFSNY